MTCMRRKFILNIRDKILSLSIRTFRTVCFMMINVIYVGYMVQEVKEIEVG